MVLSFILLSCCFYLSLVTVPSATKLKTIYEWKYIDYTWESYADHAIAIQLGYYNSSKPKIIDVDVWKNRKVFATVIRRAGVPASLTTVSSESGDGGPLLQPYPNWRWGLNWDCNGITNAYRIAIDECDRLWVLDNGHSDDEQICPPQLLAFQLNTNRLIHRVTLPFSFHRYAGLKPSLLVTLVVETEGDKCQQTHVYVADVTGHTFLVWNGTSLWNVQSPTFAHYKSSLNITHPGEYFELADGVLSMAVIPKGIRETRYLVVQTLGSFDINFVNTLQLQQPQYRGISAFKHYPRVLSSQAVAIAFSSQGILFVGLTSEAALVCWDINKKRGNSDENIVKLEQNRETLQFASSLKVIPDRMTNNFEQIWMVSNRFQNIAEDIRNFDIVNFRIIGGYVNELIADTNCVPTL